MQARQRQILYIITYMWNLKNKSQIYIVKQKQTHQYRKQTSGFSWERDGGGVNYEYRIKRYKLLWIDKKGILYNTENFSHY